MAGLSTLQTWATESELESAQTDRERYGHPTDWQRIFHSDWQLALHGHSPWLPATVEGHIDAPSKNAFGTEPRSMTTERVFECNLNAHLARKRTHRVKLEKLDKWLVIHGWADHRTRESPISAQLSEVLSASHRILDLRENWDGEGSPAYSETTLKRAIDFLTSSASRYWRDHQKKLTAPRILPGPDGNIDIHWKTPQRELLISIPASLSEPASYYGDDKDDGTENAIRGRKLDVSTYNEWIIAWLMR